MVAVVVVTQGSLTIKSMLMWRKQGGLAMGVQPKAVMEMRAVIVAQQAIQEPLGQD